MPMLVFFFPPPPFCTPHQSNRAPLDPFFGSEGEPARLFRARKLEHGAQLRPFITEGLGWVAPSIAEQGGRNRGLLGATKHAPPPALPASPAGVAKRLGGTRRPNTQEVTDKFVRQPHMPTLQDVVALDATIRGSVPVFVRAL